jgi:hypothetical protein
MDLRASVDDQRLAGEEVTLGRAKEQETPDQAVRDFGALQGAPWMRCWFCASRRASTW